MNEWTISQICFAYSLTELSPIVLLFLGNSPYNSTWAPTSWKFLVNQQVGKTTYCPNKWHQQAEWQKQVKTSNHVIRSQIILIFRLTNSISLCSRLNLLPPTPQLPGEKGGGDGGAEAGGAEDAPRWKRAASVSDTEADGHHRWVGAAAAQSLIEQLCTAASAAGAPGHRERPHSRHLCRLSSRSVCTSCHQSLFIKFYIYIFKTHPYLGSAVTSTVNLHKLMWSNGRATNTTFVCFRGHRVWLCCCTKEGHLTLITTCFTVKAVQYVTFFSPWTYQRRTVKCRTIMWCQINEADFLLQRANLPWCRTLPPHSWTVLLSSSQETLKVESTLSHYPTRRSRLR